MHRIAHIAVACLAIPAFAAPAPAQTVCADYGDTGWWPVASIDLPSAVTELAATDDGRLLAASDAGLLVYDLADPVAPVLAGFVSSTAPLREIAVDGSTVAALTTDDRLLLGVLATPEQNRWVGELPLTGAALLQLDGGLVVVRQLLDQLATVDVSDPKVPRYLGFLQLSESFADLQVADGLALAATQFSLFTVCSLADPALPEIISTAGALASGTAIALDFPRVRVGNIRQIITYDLSDPAAPIRVQTSPRLLGIIDGLSVDRDHTFAATGEGHLHRLDAAGPDSLVLVGHTHDPVPVRHHVLAGDLLYAVRDPLRLDVYDPVGGRHPQHLTMRLERGVPVTAARHELFYELDSDHPEGARLAISTIVPDTGLVEVSTLPIFGDAVAVDLQGDRLVYATDQTTLAILDIADPAAPAYISLRNDDFFVRDVVLLGGLAGIIGRDQQGEDLLVLYDRRSEPSLFLAGAVRVPFAASRVVRSGDRALVQTEFEMNGVMLLDLDVPSEPLITDWIAMPAPCVDVLADGEYAYVSTSAGTVEIVSLEDPYRLSVVRRLELDAGAGSLALVASTLLVQDQNTGFTLVDVTDPEAAEVVGAAWVPTTGQVLAGTSGFVVNDAFNRQRSILPGLCGSLSAVEPAPPLLLPELVAAPNPFNPRTEISFFLERPARVDLDVYDLAGRLVRRLADGRAVPAGPGAIRWNGRDDAGRNVAAGVYLARLRADGASATAKLVLVR